MADTRCEVLGACAADARVERARRWLLERAPAEEILVVGANADAASELLRAAALERSASFGWHRVTLGRLAAELARPLLIERELTPIGQLASEAVVARVLHEMRSAGSLGRYTRAAGGPGLARAIARTLAEVRMAGLAPDAFAKSASELEAIARAYEAELAAAGLADRATVFALASGAAADPAAGHPLLGLPTLLLDVSVGQAVERDLVRALAARAPSLVATVPTGDAETQRNLEAALGVPAGDLASSDAPTSLRGLQAHLFEESAPPPSPLEEDVVVLSAPGENRECVEIARRLLRFAADGVPFDRMAVLLRSPAEYRPHLEEAFARAAIPAHFARAALRPDPAGRAFLALLACAAEGLSARRFAEYLSLGEVPDATREGAPPEVSPAGERWVPPDEELVPSVVAGALGEASPRDDDEPLPEDPDAQAVVAGTLRAPRRWEQLLVDAAVIGGGERWARRLAGLEQELRLAREALDDADDPRHGQFERDLQDLAHLRAYALPLITALDALPDRERWGDWLDALSALASRALRHPERVLSVLAELTPMGAVGPVALEEVVLVLSERLQQVAVPPSTRRFGCVFVADPESARGLAFDVVFVPGLAERLFPRKIVEDPILLDVEREALPAGLATNEARVARERLALRLAVGAARQRVVLSYPRLDLDHARPRVPSFYALEALRAAEGRLPGFDELAARAESLTDARVGWPAPREPEDAIDEAEHDLALLERVLQRDPDRAVGTARYLLEANPHLGRALRFRARRWRRRWSAADGLVEPGEAGRAAIRAHGLAARSYSPTALQHLAACPYRFLLQAVHRLSPREVPEAIEELDPLQRGSLVHRVQFELFEKLRDADLLPVTPPTLARARALLDEVLDRVAAQARDDLAPAIDRVWEDGIESVRADLREWLRRASEDDSGFVPWRFELAFGMPGSRGADPHSSSEPVRLDCGIGLRGYIDLVERTGDGRLRATDHKTGRVRVADQAILAGGDSLQPVLYALALDKLFPEDSVDAGRLYYCTAAAGFEERVIPLDERARKSAAVLAEVVDDALSRPFLPAAPASRACDWCDYRVVCGPYEELRTSRKPRPELEPLARLRRLR